MKHRSTLIAVLCMALNTSIPALAQSGHVLGESNRSEVYHDGIRNRALSVIEHQFGAFQDASATLSASAVEYCDNGAPRSVFEDSFRAAWLSWAPLDSYQFGPVEATGAALAVNFWPDKKNFVGRALHALLKQNDAAQRDPQIIAAGSAAGQGFPALEMLLYSDLPECPAIIGISAYVDLMAQTLFTDWFKPGGWADLTYSAGPDNPVYVTEAEFTKTLFTAVDFGLFRVSEQRLGRPLGTYDRSFPKRAEAWRSGLTNALTEAQLFGISEMIEFGFSGSIVTADRTRVLSRLERTRARLRGLDMPLSQAVAAPTSRFRVEAMQSQVNAVRDDLAQSIGPQLGVDAGFSPADGD
ncbi:MAG: imelysin family protein [Paracoccaceae bacterium]|jgi:hypothetical protein